MCWFCCCDSTNKYIEEYNSNIGLREELLDMELSKQELIVKCDKAVQERNHYKKHLEKTEEELRKYKKFYDDKMTDYLVQFEGGWNVPEAKNWPEKNEIREIKKNIDNIFGLFNHLIARQDGIDKKGKL